MPVPTPSGPGWLAALDVVLPSGGGGRLAVLAGRLGFATVWVRAGADLPAAADLRRLAADCIPARLGLLVEDADRAAVAALARAAAVPLRVGLLGPAAAAGGLDLPAEATLAVEPAGGGRPEARPTAVEALGAGADLLVRAPDRAALARRLTDLAAVRRAARAPAAAGRTLTALVPVAIGRTFAEAQARAGLDARLRDVAAAGLFGTLEQAQDQALELVRAGADALACTLADAADVHDLLAQLRAVATGPASLRR